MGKIPNKPEEIFDEFKKEYESLFGEDLLAIILYGSGARNEYIPKKSDINFLIVLTDEGMDRVGDATGLVAKWEKRSVSVPLFLTLHYIESSLDTFPLEFFDMRSAYQVTYGEDILRDLTIRKEDLRLQCERELKAKLLLLRESFLQGHGKPRPLRDLVVHSLTAFTSLFKALLYLKGDELPGTYGTVITGMAEAFGLDRGLFETLSHIKRGEAKPGKAEMRVILLRYISEIKKLSRLVDKME
jgi:predicted nucleotidyltransferase